VSHGTVDFFEHPGGELPVVEWSGPGVTDGPIPATALFHVPVPTAVAMLRRPR